ncbi:MAG: cache domain-containing protein, partial [Alsobacter sp.]
MDAQNIKLRRGLPLRVHLVIFGLICFIPASVAVWFVGFNLARAEQRRVEGQAFRIVQDFSRAVDAEVSSLTKALQALSSSPALEMRDHARFREQAAVVARDNAATIALRELSGRHVINTLLPYGTSPMPVTADPVLTAADRRAIETRMPVSTDLYIGVTGKRPYVTVVMPVVSGGEVVALLSMAVTPERIGEKLRLGALAEEGWLAAVVGADGRVIARSRDADRFVGQPATGDLARAI